jgi:DNA-binding HxlR family transcriptional regulator
MASRRGPDNELAPIIEDFLLRLDKAIAKRKPREYSVEEMEERMESVVSVLGVLSQRWSLGMIYLLYMKSLKFNELRDLLHGISSRTLTDKLRMLEGSGILTRSVTSSAPVRVSYTLTTRGREIALSCLPLLYQLHKEE